MKQSRPRTAAAPDRTDRRPADDGSALVITLMVMAVVAILVSALLAAVINNVSSSRRAVDAATALDAADAGVNQALAYLRFTGASNLDCSPTCTANPWGNKVTPQSVTMPGGTHQKYDVWIEPKPATNPTYYRIHSHGSSSTGSRDIEVDATLVAGMARLPLGVFARTIEGGGSATVTRESVFSTGCVYNRSKIAMGTSIDAAYGIRAGVHSAQIITDANGNTPTCSVGRKAIHRTSACDPQYPYDQDSIGGSLTSTGCSGALTAAPQYYAPRDLDGNGTTDVNGSWVRDAASLMKLFNISDKPLTDDQLDGLRTVARSQGNYWTNSSGWTAPNPATTPNAVMFFDLAQSDPGGTVNLNNVTGWGRAGNLAATSASCPKRSLLIVIDGGNAKMNSNISLAASLVLTSAAPYGVVTHANGTADFIGTIFGDHVNLVGNVDISLDPCFLKNLSPGLYSVEVRNYREIDR
jgi:Tfp pilus assembly protein PilX